MKLTTGFHFYKGIEIFYIDYSDCNDELDWHKRIDNAEFLFYSSGKKNIRMAVDFSNSRVTRWVVDKMVQLATRAKPFRKNMGITGITGVKKTIIKVFNAFVDKEFPHFPTMEDVLEYIIKD